ncbi:PD-(D/E)XK nuclease family protein [Phaeocystidibacter marisrubri]|uniref:PD-(D/E)XK nuclease family protein n=1 Tax=Phaeocystidibacter marisrubri TaxID=1577780 RepID=A0A6L3ZEE4_9FLAO|nr:PD-(D/E)XK nuclease family protein [Phaeocystidibacter marisrubri]KAB2815827.1 PD-(D/E)XK nuclease family protein [Phaeocystidibacter marisrubri]GGH65916.1 hypothetical protein GCM10011318_03370 [Phaeocystidibacter marisrubri]
MKIPQFTNTQDIDSILSDLLERIPEKEKRPSTIFDIAGITSDEVKNSKILQYYLDPNADHELGDTFIQAMCDCFISAYPEKSKNRNKVVSIIEDIKSNTAEHETISVVTEVPVEKKFVDIYVTNTLYEGANQDESNNELLWSMVIENKIYADLYNPIETYWSVDDCDTKILPILSIYPLREELLESYREKSVLVSNITHETLIKNVLSRITAKYDSIPTRQLFLLQEYYSNIVNLTKRAAMKFKEERFQLFQKRIEDVNEMRHHIYHNDRYVVDSVTNAFNALGYKSKPKARSVVERWFIFSKKNELLTPLTNWSEEDLKKLRFYVNMNPIKHTNTFKAEFELFTKKGVEAHFESIRKKVLALEWPDFIEVVNENPKTDYAHILRINFKLSDLENTDDINLEERVKLILEMFFKSLK